MCPYRSCRFPWRRKYKLLQWPFSTSFRQNPSSRSLLLEIFCGICVWAVKNLQHNGDLLQHGSSPRRIDARPRTHPENTHIFHIPAVSVGIPHWLWSKHKTQDSSVHDRQSGTIRMLLQYNWHFHSFPPDVFTPKRHANAAWRPPVSRKCCCLRWGVRHEGACGPWSRTSSWRWRCWRGERWACRTRRSRPRPPCGSPWWCQHGRQGNVQTKHQCHTPKRTIKLNDCGRSLFFALSHYGCVWNMFLCSRQELCFQAWSVAGERYTMRSMLFHVQSYLLMEHIYFFMRPSICGPHCPQCVALSKGYCVHISPWAGIRWRWWFCWCCGAFSREGAMKVKTVEENEAWRNK